MTRYCAPLLAGVLLGLLLPAAIAYAAIELIDPPIKDLRQC